MQNKTKLYLESSVICMYYQDSAPYLMDLTRLFWENKLPYSDTYISEIVLDEIGATKNIRLRESLENLIKDFKVIEITDDITNLSNIYISHRRIPRGDALHLASASIGEMDFLVTWNLRHLYKRGTQEVIKEINTRLMIPIPAIVTPEDFFGEDI
jgi:predicted nucleic acid-binding protein